MHTFGFAFFLTLLTGLATGIGGLFAFFVKKNDFRLLSFIMGFSGGVMIYVSLTALIPEGFELLAKGMTLLNALWITLFSFGVGAVVMLLVDRFFPEQVLDNEVKNTFRPNQKVLLKSGITVAFLLALHNLPEGLSTFMALLSGLDVSYPIALSMALHNIPEGIAVCLPVYFLTKSAVKSFLIALLSGFIEPLGALMGYFLFLPFIKSGLIGLVFTFAGGMMVLVSFKALYPVLKKGEESFSGTLGFFVIQQMLAI